MGLLFYDVIKRICLTKPIMQFCGFELLESVSYGMVLLTCPSSMLDVSNVYPYRHVKLTAIYFSPLGLYLDLFIIFLVGERLLSVWVVSIPWQ